MKPPHKVLVQVFIERPAPGVQRPVAVEQHTFELAADINDALGAESTKRPLTPTEVAECMQHLRDYVRSISAYASDPTFRMLVQLPAELN